MPGSALFPGAQDCLSLQVQQSTRTRQSGALALAGTGLGSLASTGLNPEGIHFKMDPVRLPKARGARATKGNSPDASHNLALSLGTCPG